jgi:hypothetical protein
MTNLDHADPVRLARAVSSPLQTGDHYVLRKLCNQILPWLISGRRLKRLWFVRVGAFWSYTGDLAAAMAGLGIGTPLVALTSGKKTLDGKTGLDVIREVFPGQLFYVGAIGLIAWVILRLVVQREDIVTRALLARDCVQSMRALRQQLWISLSDADPMPRITLIQKSIDDQVQNAIKNRVWPWEPLPPSEEIATELKSMIDEIRTRFMNGWAPPPPGVL